jgi:hypothetical protein
VFLAFIQRLSDQAYKSMERFLSSVRRTEAFTFNEICTSVLGPIVIVAALLGVLLGTGGNCEYNIRLWLWVVLGVNVVYALLILSVIAMSVMVNQDTMTCAGHTAAFCRLLLGLFMLAWLIVGNIWLYSSDSCSSDWLPGFVTTLIFLIFGYIAFAMILGFCVCLRSRHGVFGMKSADDEHVHSQENQQPLQEHRT